MKDGVVRPVVFNVVTIAALLFSLLQLLFLAPERATATTDEAIEILGELAGEGDGVYESLRARLQTDKQRRQVLSTGLILTMVIAISANIVANRFGRERQHTNLARIRQLETQLKREQSRRLQGEG